MKLCVSCIVYIVDKGYNTWAKLDIIISRHSVSHPVLDI